MQKAKEKRKTVRRRPPRFELMGGPVCLDFINTLDDRFSSEPKELLKSYIDLARFGEDTGFLDTTRVDHLFELSYTAPEDAARVLRAAIQLREAMYGIFWALVKKKPVAPADLVVLNQYVQIAAQHSMLVKANGRFEWRFDNPPSDLECVLWPIARSAAVLLASENVAYVRACASKTCEWLFLDESKNHRRRWCDMKKCGNRAKFRSFYERQKKGR